MILEAQLVAGIRLDVAWLQASIASGDPRLEPLAIDVAEGVQRGEAVAPKLQGRRELPPPFADFYANGEQTGRLDECLVLIQREFRARAASRLQVVALAYPGFLFALVGLAIVYKVITFWLGYFKQLEQFQ
jgi:type II secretory pathway component PulF